MKALLLPEERSEMQGKDSDDAQLMFAFAHDLRGYLRTMLTRVQIVQSTGVQLLPEQDRTFLEEAVTAARDMDGLIAAMVSYCDPPASGENMPLGLMLRGVLMEMKPVIAEAGATISVTNEVEVDVPVSLRFVVKELLTNSCKFCHPERKPDVRIVATLPDASTLEISVQDNGSGVDAEMPGKMFLPFRRMHSRSNPGHGLGLARSRRIVEALGGTIAARHRNEGGLAVTLKVPLASHLAI